MVSPIPTIPCGLFDFKISNSGSSTTLSTSGESTGSVSSELAVATLGIMVPSAVPAFTVT